MSLSRAIEPDHDDTERLTEAQHGDRAAFVPMIQEHYEPLFRWLVQMTHDSHLAEDLVQETFLKAFANLRRFKPGTNFRAWLFRIAHNSLISQHRSMKRQREPLTADVEMEEEIQPLDKLEQEEEIEQISQAIDELPEQFRSAFLLRVNEEYSFREIANILGLSEETARWRVFKARKLLMQSLNPKGNRSCREL